MKFDIYHKATPEMKELFTILIEIQADLLYVKSIAQRLEKELPEEENHGTVRNG